MSEKYLVIQSFYNRSLAQRYVLNGHGLGFLSLFLIAAITALIYAVKIAFFAADITPQEIRMFTQNVPEIKIVDGQIVEPKNFFQRLQLANGINLTLDTTDGEAVTETQNPSEIYISKDAVHFINGNRIELFPLNSFLNTDDITLTQENIHTFIKKLLDEMVFAIPSLTFLIALPLLFFKFVVLTYGLALITYLMTLYPRVPLTFEERMRLSVISCLPVFIINLIFGTMLSWFTLGSVGGVLVAFVYMYYYLAQLPKEIEITEE